MFAATFDIQGPSRRSAKVMKMKFNGARWKRHVEERGRVEKKEKEEKKEARRNEEEARKEFRRDWILRDRGLQVRGST